MKNQNLYNVIMLVVVVSILIIIGCTKQKVVDCNSVSSANLQVACLDTLNYRTPQGQYYKKNQEAACMAVPFGEPGINYRIFYGENASASTIRRYTLVGDIPSGNSTVIGPYSTYVDAYPVINGKICENKLIRRYKYDNFDSVDSFGDWVD